MQNTAERISIPDRPTLEKVVRHLLNFTVALFGENRNGGDFCGSGTLVSVANSLYILTAAHVWDSLRSYPWVVMTLKESVDHCFEMITRTIEASEIIKPQEGWGEWGPDLCFLRLPPYYVNSIQTYKTFYNLTKRRDQTGNLEWWALMGAPQARGNFTERHADFAITGDFLGIAAVHDKDGFDYLDIGVDLSLAEAPSSFAGISGGGLWRLTFTESGSGQFTWNFALKGVAFYQSPVVDGHRFIRCHGPKSIQELMSAR